MSKRVLVPLDGSPLAQQILPYAVWLARTTGAALELFRVVETPMAVDGEAAYGDYVIRIQALARDEARAAMETTGRALTDAGVAATSTVVDSDGSPIAMQIGREAERIPDTVIAVSTHGRSGVGRWLLGSVTDKLLHITSCPLFVVHPSDAPSATPVASWRPATVLVPLDGSPVAERALPTAVALAGNASLRVHLVRVVADDDEVPAARQALAGQVKEIASEVPSGVTFEVLRGDPAGALVAAAKLMPDNLIVMTTHGRGGLERWMLGSVTDRVVRYSRDPVFVIRARPS
ncbi:MAG: universal stress protein [Armatimonadetes bacterium]|nr:universal stress protein [Armatimonadota bacterium]